MTQKQQLIITVIISIVIGFCVSNGYPADLEKTKDMFTPITEKASKEHGVDEHIVRAIIMAESTFNPNAKSNRGAKGLMQLMPRTAKSLGVKNAFDPEQNVNAGVKYFKQLLTKFDMNFDLALAAYNAGARKVLRHGGVPDFPATKRYIRKVKKYRKFYKGG